MENKMEIDQKLNHSVQCRLCANTGAHQFELFDSPSMESSSSLTEKILRCLGIKVISSDPTTVICAECFNKLHGYDQFREVCHATDRKMKKSHRRHLNGVILKSKVKRETAIAPAATSVSLVDSDLESNAEANVAATSRNPTPKIERSEDDLAAQIIDLAESSADEIPDREIISDGRIVDFPSDAHVSGSRTGADRVDHVAPVPRKILRKTSSKTKTIEDGHEMNQKTMENALRFTIKCSSSTGCRDLFESSEAVMLHAKTYHKNFAERSFSRHMCKQTVAYRRNLELHMNSFHTPVVRFMCPKRLCSKMFTTNRGLKVHLNTVHKNQVTLRCTTCSKPFSREHLLKKHLAYEHGKGVAFVCYLCRNPYASEFGLRKHFKFTHTRVTLFKCPEAKCFKAFKEMYAMNRHFDSVHSRKKVYKCMKCPAKFFWAESLRNHMILKH